MANGNVNFHFIADTGRMNGVELYAYLRDLFISLANGHLAKDIDALMPWAYAQRTSLTRGRRSVLGLTWVTAIA